MDNTQQRSAHAHATRVKPAAATKSAVHLSRLAATNLVLYYKVKAAHWTVSGPLFWQIHKLLDRIAGVAFEAIDPLAERTRQIDFLPPLTLAEAKKLSIVEERAKDTLGNREMLEAIDGDMARASEAYRQAALETAEEDPGSNNLIGDLLDKHDSVAWFLRETLVKGGVGEM